MKKFLCLIVAVILTAGVFIIPADAEEKFRAEGSCYLLGEEVRFSLEAENLTYAKETVYVYSSVYNSDSSLKSVKMYELEIGGKSKARREYSETIKNGAVKFSVWDKNMKPLTRAYSSEDASRKIDVRAADVWATAVPEKENAPANVTDGDVGTKWTASEVSAEEPESITFCFEKLITVTNLGIAFGSGNQRDYVFEVSASQDGENFTTILDATVAERTNDIQYFMTKKFDAKFVRVTSLGRKDAAKGWIQISEIEVFGKDAEIYTGVVARDDFEDLDAWDIRAMDEMTFTDYKPSLGSKLYARAESNAMELLDEADRGGLVSGEKLGVYKAEASQTPEADNNAGNTTDGSLDTKWTARDVSDSTPAVLTLTLEDTYFVSGIGLAFGVGNERVYTYSVDVSKDGVYFENVISKIESEKTIDVQRKDFAQSEAKYVRFTFYSRTDSKNNGWLQVTEAEVYGTENGIEGAGGILAQRRFNPPDNRADYEIKFRMNIGNNPYFAGFSLTDGVVSGGADLARYAAMQIRFDNENNRVKVNRIKSDYFNEGTPDRLFDSTFLKYADWDVTVKVSPKKRMTYITIDDGTVRETKALGFAYNDDELTRPCRWTGYEANTFVFNTGAGAKCRIEVSDFEINGMKTIIRDDAAVNGIVRLEAVRLSSDATGNAYYGRFVTHNGEGENAEVVAEREPALTRFVEREGLIGCGVSLEAVTAPGCFLTVEDDRVVLKKWENSGDFCAKATFIKEKAENLGYYTGECVSYKSYINREKYIYDSSAVHRTGNLKAGSIDMPSNMTFYLRSEAVNYVSDNFYGDRISSQWWTNYPWKGNNPTRDSYNFSALITKNNVIVENGELLLKATKISGWPENIDGETGIQYNKWGKTWEKWKGYTGVVSIKDKVYNRQCYLEGSFKQPDSPIGYWNAFWLTGRDSWPPEIDIFETLSSSYGHNAWHTALHGEGDKNNLLGKQTSSVNVATGYHTFALDWGYDYMKFYVDGKIFAKVQNHATVNFQKNVRLILNTGIGGWEAEPDDTMVWDDGLRCKYIRSFQY